MSPPKGSTPHWFTPLDLFRSIEDRLGITVDLDPCGHAKSPVSRLIKFRGGTVLTRKDNGLKQPWPLGCWAFVNPEYRTPTITNWMRFTQVMAHMGRNIIALVPAWTDRRWWQLYVEPDRKSGRAEVDFLPGRQCFGFPDDPYGKKSDNAKFPSAVIVWRASWTPSRIG